MIIMNILVKFHDWIDNIQKKLNLTKKTLNDLKWILATKDIELKVKDHEVKELRHSIDEYEKKHNIREVSFLFKAVVMIKYCQLLLFQ